MCVEATSIIVVLSSASALAWFEINRSSVSNDVEGDARSLSGLLVNVRWVQVNVSFSRSLRQTCRKLDYGQADDDVHSVVTVNYASAGLATPGPL